MTIAWVLVIGSLIGGLYTYAGYPLILAMLRLRRTTLGAGALPEAECDWPTVSICVPAYNEEHQIGSMIESLLALDYPADHLQIVVVSDASTDGTDAIVREFADRGVELVRQPVRRGKTAAESLAARLLSGEIVVNTDASIRIHPHSLKKIVRPFRDPQVGLASGRDVSVGLRDREANVGEAGYVGYEMWVRGLETAVRGIVGASGCFYAIRRELHDVPLPESLSRDFAAALHTHEYGYRALSVPEATCSVPRTSSLRTEYHRKVRTMARGMQTLRYKRALLNPVRHGLFAWMLFSHKVMRWLLPWVAIAGLAGLLVLASEFTFALALFALFAIPLAAGTVVWALARDRTLPTALALPAFAVMGNVAAIRALGQILVGDRRALWEPTRRETEPSTQPTLLCVANYPANTGFAWTFIETLYARVAERLAPCGVRTLVAYPRIDQEPRMLADSPAQGMELEVRLGTPTGVASVIRLVRRENIRALYLSDRAAWHPAYTILRGAGIAHIVVHDHTSGERTRPTGLKHAVKWLSRRLPGSIPDRVLVVSDFVRRRKVEVDLIPDHRVHTLWNSVDVPPAPMSEPGSVRARIGVSADRLLVTCGSRATREKGIDVLFRAFDLMLATSPLKTGRPLLVYMGDGPGLEGLKRLRSKLASRDDIVLTGYREDAREIFGASDLCVVPSRWAEAFGLAALEPMAWGVPVIASRIGGLPEVVLDGQTGRLVPPDDPDALANAMAELLANPRERERLGYAGRIRARDCFGMDRQIDELVCHIQSGLLEQSAYVKGT